MSRALLSRPLAPALLPVLAVLYLMSAPVAGAVVDYEGYRNAVLSAVLQTRALFAGESPFWTSALGFGVPLPLHPDLFMHPLSPLFAALAPQTGIRVLYVVHAALGTAGCWWLVRYLGAGRPIAGVGAATYVLATNAVNYASTDFWPSHFIGWSLLPYLVLFAVRVLDRRDGVPAWVDGVAFGSVAGLMVANGHAGQVSVLFAVLAIMVIVEIHRAVRTWWVLALAVGVGVLIAGRTLDHLLGELQRFPPLENEPVYVDLGWSAARDLLTRPFEGYRSPRLPFFGGPMLVAALAYCFGLARGVRYRPAIVIAFMASAAAMFYLPPGTVQAFSGNFVFRDPFTLLGITAAALALHSLGARWPRAVAGICALQIAVVAIAAWPFISGAWRYGPGVERAFLGHHPITDALREWAARLPGRWYLAPEIDDLIRRGRFESDGLVPEGWAYRGLPVVNGSFKAVSVDSFYPTGTLPLGRIRGETAVAAHPETLAVLGVSVVLATATEPVAPALELEEVARFDVRDGPMRLLRVPQPWPGAAFVDEGTIAQSPPELPECRQQGVLCRDLSGVARAAHDTFLRVSRAGGELRLRFPPDGKSSRWMIVSEMHRPEWVAYAAGKQVTVRPVWDALIGVEVPPGADEVMLVYRPMRRMALTLVSAATLTGALVVVVGSVLRHRASRPRRQLA